MADDTIIIEGTVKFRDGKKWKSRWCVMRKLSPVADCVHVQLFRDARARRAGAAAGCKAALSLQRFVGCEAGFTLDKHSHTLALVCRDLVAVLAFETRERLMQWQVKVSAHLGSPRQYLVLVEAASGGGGGGSRLAAGPARLHVHQRCAALTAGVPPRLLGLWEINHLRRYGVVEGRFCFEGGSHCGKGEGLHVLITDQAKEISHDFNLAALGRLSPRRRPTTLKKNEGIESPESHKAYRPDTRLSELNTIDGSLQPVDSRLYEEPYLEDDEGAISPYWPSAERGSCHDMGLGDTVSVHETVDGSGAPPWHGARAGAGAGAGSVTLERCRSCMSKLGALSRSSTAALTPGAKHFSPAWTMDAVHEAPAAPSAADFVPSHCDSISSLINKTEEVCVCPERVPDRPPKPTRLELNLDRKPASSGPGQACNCLPVTAGINKPFKIGPFENYDVPKIPSAEVEGEYYDTPKRLKECITDELFKVTKNSTSDAVILKKPCGCLLKFGKRRNEPKVIESEENLQPASCPCRRVTDWAQNLIKIPYCRKSTDSSESSVPNKENIISNSTSDPSSLYATIDLSRKTKRKMHLHDITSDSKLNISESRTVEIDEGPLANYENLNFALSLEHYENAKDLLRKAGITQTELDAISANLRPVSFVMKDGERVCNKCGHPPTGKESKDIRKITTSQSVLDEYLLMEPNCLSSSERENRLPSGYAPMSPIGFQTMKNPVKCAISRLIQEKSASNPTLFTSANESTPIEANSTNIPEPIVVQTVIIERVEKIEYRKRSSSADSSRFLEDVKEFDSSVGSPGSTSSIETLRNLALQGGRVATPGGDKHSDADSSEASKEGRRQARGLPGGRAAGTPGGAGGAGGTGGNRDSSSSNDSGVSSCSLRAGAGRGGAEFELPPTTAAARRRYRRAAPPPRALPPRRSRSTDPLREAATVQRVRLPPKSSSAEAEVPVLSLRSFRGVVDTHSTSSGTSDMSDYIETLSICSSHSSTDTPVTMRVVRQTTSTLRPRSGKEYQNLDPRLTSACRAAHPAHPAHPHHLYQLHHSHLYSNLP